ncbi:hypothetical protein ABT270_34050 [Streptomyces sp900105245]|uniref:hypothetical protein n=1 Tax=Streptomyces sp. 900105245 TaxID=3154379 RepID=UPI003322CD13
MVRSAQRRFGATGQAHRRQPAPALFADRAGYPHAPRTQVPEPGVEVASWL